jgi:hypothetical protein
VSKIFDLIDLATSNIFYIAVRARTRIRAQARPGDASLGLTAQFRAEGRTSMRKHARGFLLVLSVFAASVFSTAPAVADEYPLVAGDFWDVSGIHIKDGGGLAYATFLAGEWRRNQEFGKSKGWIKGYMILANNYPRKGEPDIYLITITERIATGAEGEKRSDEYLEWRKTTIAQMEKESGNRAEFRELGSNSLLQELKFRN